VKKITAACIFIAIIIPMTGCQSTTKTEPALDKATLNSAKLMTKDMYYKIVEGIPPSDKFDNFQSYREKYNAYTTGFGVHYSDIKLTDWDSINHTYKLSPTIITNYPTRHDTYKATNGYGAEFTVDRYVVHNDRIQITYEPLKKILIGQAKELDNTIVRVYYTLGTQKKDVGNSHLPLNSEMVCRDQRYSDPKTGSPIQILDEGCRLPAEAIAIKSLKLNILLPMTKSSLSMTFNDNFDHYKVISQ